MHAISVGLFTILFLFQQAHGQSCRTDSMTAHFSSDPASEGALAISFSAPGGTTKSDEILDDTGYLSSKILTSYLVSSTSWSEIDTSKNGETIRLLRLRLQLLEKTMRTRAIASMEKDPSYAGNALKLVAAAREMNLGLNKSSIDRSLLRERWMKIESLVRVKPSPNPPPDTVLIRAESRSVGTSLWEGGAEMPSVPIPKIKEECGGKVYKGSVILGKVNFGDAIKASISDNSINNSQAQPAASAGGTK